MPRPRNITPTRKLEVALPEDVLTRLQLYLTSDLDSKVPFAAYQSFFIARINEFFGTRSLDFSELTGSPQGSYVIRGAPDTLKTLSQLLDKLPP